jgi:hypothetical protein
MKIKGELYAKMEKIMREGVAHIVEYNSFDTPKEIAEAYANVGLTRDRMLWDCWHSAQNHAGEGRLDMFRVYKGDSTLNDNHLATALRKIGKDLGI